MQMAPPARLRLDMRSRHMQLLGHLQLLLVPLSSLQSASQRDSLLRGQHDVCS